MISSPASDTVLEAKSVQELQQLAHEAAARRQKASRKQRGLSRASQLHLIDLMSRWGGVGLALIAGVSVFLAVTAGQLHPLRAGVWATLVLAAIYVCRRSRKEFRSGEQIASRPFRWRANYTSALSVLGAAFGAGAYILLPAGAGYADALQTLFLILVAAIGASALHTPHPRAAMAVGVPAGLFALFGMERALGFGIPFFASLGLSAASVIGLIFASRKITSATADRFPRTTFLRQELKQPAEPASRAAVATATAAL